MRRATTKEITWKQTDLLGDAAACGTLSSTNHHNRRGGKRRGSSCCSFSPADDAWTTPSGKAKPLFSNLFDG